MLTYLLTREGLTPEEVNGHAVDVVAAGVDTVRKNRIKFKERTFQSGKT